MFVAEPEDGQPVTATVQHLFLKALPVEEEEEKKRQDLFPVNE